MTTHILNRQVLVYNRINLQEYASISDNIFTKVGLMQAHFFLEIVNTNLRQFQTFSVVNPKCNTCTYFFKDLNVDFLLTLVASYSTDWISLC